MWSRNMKDDIDSFIICEKKKENAQVAESKTNSHWGPTMRVIPQPVVGYAINISIA